MTALKSQFFAQLQSRFEERSRSVAQKRAWEQFRALGLPSRSDEAYRYVSLQPLYASTFALPAQEMCLAALPALAGARIVFVNGSLKREWSDLSILPTGAITLETGGTEVEEEKDPMATLCAALCFENNRLVLHKDPGSLVHIVHVIQGENPLLIPLQLEIEVQSRVSARCAFSTHVLGASQSHCFLGTISCVLDDYASMEFSDHRTHVMQEFSFDHTRCSLKKKSTLLCKHLSFGGTLARRRICAKLFAEGGRVELKGCDQLRKRAQMHTHVRIEHLAPKTSSMQTFKGVLWDQADLSFEGQIYIAPGAQKTEAYQRSDSLLLNHEATARAKPRLEIYADDVQASHGATVAKIDSSQKFYLQTRGLSAAQAEESIAQGFCRDIY